MSTRICRDQFVVCASIGGEAVSEFYCTRKLGHAGQHSCEVKSLRRDSENHLVNEGYTMSDEENDGEDSRKVGTLSWQ